MERFLGGKPLAVLLKVVIVSIVAGIALNAMGFDPRHLLNFIPRLVRAIYDLGFWWADSIVDWFLLGAVIVIPIWLIIRVLKFISGEGKRDGGL